MNEFGLMPVAVRVLPGCVECVRKCLREGLFYYLNNDYEISQDGKSIIRRRRQIEPVDSYFFRTDNDTSLSVNLSAIVGMNGDGKSSLVELIVRLLNNYALKSERHPELTLIKAEGVRAEFYYKLNGHFYCLIEDEEGIRILRYDDIGEGEFISDTPLDKSEVNDEFFFTLVSNYSHYAYNTQEVDNYDKMLRDDEHWLHYVFHKNDGYQTPLSLHPFRDKGNIDINRERELSKQRVLMTFIQASLKNDSESTMDFNGKSAVELKLTDRNSSKLQQISLRKYFKEHKGESLLQEDIENIKRIASVFGYFSDSDLQFFVSAVTTLEDIYNRYFYSIADRKIYRLALGWIEQNGLLERNSDISELIENIDRIKHNVVDSEFDVRIERLQQKFREFSKLSLLQIQRVKLIRDICVFWEKVGLHLPNHEVIRFGLPQSKIFVPFDSLTIKERCKHYLLYKTLAVFETYSSYTIDMQKEYYMFFAKSERLMYLNNAFGKLAEDWRLKSHITLKLRQTYNYIKPGRWNTSLIYGHEHKSNLVLGKLSEDIRSAMTHLDNMPPAIFYWDILFSEDGKSELVPLESFSSGEKQKLFCLAAIVYHLQNISSIGSESYRYNAVNLILEEVELYFHPEWQRSFINDLLNLIYQANIPKIKSVNLTFVTHSPYILSDIPKTNVLFMKNGLPDYSMQENTFGANINSLLKNGFFLPAIPMGEFANKKIQHLFAILHSGDFDSEELPRIYSEIMTVGEPLIRQQLLMLYNPYRALSMDDISAKAILNFLKNNQL